jgi:drug/metabolite transporter (DMT)-like permease
MTKEREGELYMVALSLLEGFFPILSIISIGLIGALHTYGFVLVFATLLLAIILYKQRRTAELLLPHAQKDLLLTSFYITLLFTLIFISLRYTTAGNVAVLLFMQLLFSYLYFNVLGKETLSPLHSWGAVMMGAGALVVLLPDDLHFNMGDALALGAAAVAPLANLYQKRARSHVGAITILTYRNLVAIPVIFLLALLFEASITLEALRDALPFLLAIAVLVYVLAKILWIEALHRISITKMSAMVALVPLFTLIFAYFILDELPSMRQLFGIFPIIVGGFLITRPATASQ